MTGNYFSIGEPGETIYICEGFATAASIYETIGEHVIVAFNCSNLKAVAERIHKEHSDAKIIIAADNDAHTENNPGLTKAQEAAEVVNGSVVYPTFQSQTTNGKPPPTDFNDLMVWEGEPTVREQLSDKIIETQELSSASWPILEPGALYGLAGEIVKTLLPHTEADGVTLLVHLLSEFSCMIGRSPHIRLDGDYSPLLFWPVVVGDTSKSRKGSGGKRIKRLYQSVDPLWTRGKHAGSLSSGEGLIYAVRDEEVGVNRKGEEVVKDEGIADKRLYLVQSEFGAMLRTMGREGNSLSGQLRDGWDGETLKPMTKGDRIQATHPHIVVCGHVTQSELLRNLNDTEMANGFGNRFCWFCVKRSKYLPFAENPQQDVMVKLVTEFQAVMKFTQTVEEIGMTNAAKAAWCEIYQELSQGTGGLAGALLDRAEAQVRRIAALYCLLDSKHDVDEKHLFAAMALWKYAAESAKFIFGDSIGDPIADSILTALQNGPMSDTGISALFGRNVTADRLSHSKATLLTQRKIFKTVATTDGRSKVEWRATN